MEVSTPQQDFMWKFQGAGFLDPFLSVNYSVWSPLYSVGSTWESAFLFGLGYFHGLCWSDQHECSRRGTACIVTS